MLHHEKLVQEIRKTTVSYFLDYENELRRLRLLWDCLGYNETIASFISDREWPCLVPRWQGLLSTQVPVSAALDDYSVIAVDGSQIYPDRHQGMACYLINTGTAFLHYSNQSHKKSFAKFDSQPFLMTNVRPEFQGNGGQITPEFVNCQRTDYEFKIAVERTLHYRDYNPLFFCDGSLIFWHLDAHKDDVKHQFIKSYCVSLQALCDQNVLCAGYISLPKSRELINSMRVLSDSEVYRGCIPCEAHRFMGNNLVDSDMLQLFLKSSHRTIVFENSSPIVKFYPVPLKPHFFYLNNGFEIVRIEIPAWIAHHAVLVDYVAQCALNQSIKGHGYPLCLAEAHEQAVVTNADRELFYALLERVMVQQNIAYSTSQKSMHKRVLSI